MTTVTVIYLSRPSPADFSDLPLPGSGDPGEPPGGLYPRDIRGLSTHEVYPSGRSPGRNVVSYTTFSPFPAGAGGYFLWHWLYSG